MLSLLRKNSFLLAVIGLGMLCVALDALADVKGIPHTERFATASFPYARTVQGCTEWRRPERFGDDWGPVSFAGACVEHDRCFHTPGASWGDCNHRFLQDLQASCDRDLASERLTKGKGGKPDAQAQKLCYEIAGLYAAKVQDRDVARRFELAQKQEQEYLAYVRGVINDVFKAVLKRGATDREQEQALKTLASDYTLDDLKAALMGQRLDQVQSGEGESEPIPDVETLPTSVEISE